jgi:ABC-type branched-subunit amino acid transport system ATPase component/ABC-type branched-subunit amino acid transport system permease subunit
MPDLMSRLPAPLRRVKGSSAGTAVSIAVFVLLATVIPATVTSLEWLSILPILIYGTMGALHVYLMLRVNRLSFASTGFMAIGGYTMALLAMHVTANVVVITISAFVVPALVAVVLGLLVLRLRGTYFVLVSFVFAEIVVLIVLNNDSVLGGRSGLSGVPVLSLFGVDFGSGGALLVVSAAMALVGVLAVATVTTRCRRQLAAIEQHESLALSLGLRVPLFTTMCLAVAAGTAGLGGAILVNTIGNAQTNSFDPLIAVDHVAYAVVGGGASMLGTLVASFALGWFSEELATRAEYADVVYGLILILVVLYARGGLAGIGTSLVKWAGRTPVDTSGAAGPGGPSAGRHAAGPRVPDQPVPDKPVQASARRAAEPADGETRLRVTGLTKAFGGVLAVSDVSVSVAPGEVVGIIGPNGAGKTTLVSLIAGTVRPTRGQVELAGKDVARLSPAGRCRRGLGRSYQQTAVFAPATVAENLERARTFGGSRLSREELGELAVLVGLGDRLDDIAGELPYGLQKMLGLVMAFGCDPQVLLLDEPAAGLEAGERTRVDALVDVARNRGCSVLLVEHDMELVRRLCPRLVVLDSGRMLAEGPTEQVLADPAVITAYLGAEDADLPADMDPSHPPAAERPARPESMVGDG